MKWVDNEEGGSECGVGPFGLYASKHGTWTIRTPRATRYDSIIASNHDDEKTPEQMTLAAAKAGAEAAIKSIHKEMEKDLQLHDFRDEPTCFSCGAFGPTDEEQPCVPPSPVLLALEPKVSANAFQIAKLVSADTRMLTLGMCVQNTQLSLEHVEQALAELVAVGWLVPEAGLFDEDENLWNIEWSDYVEHRDHGNQLIDPRTGEQVSPAKEIMLWWSAGPAVPKESKDE